MKKVPDAFQSHHWKLRRTQHQRQLPHVAVSLGNIDLPLLPCVATHSAVMRQYVVSPSVCLSVTFRYRYHKGWSTCTSKIISRPNSLRHLLTLTTAWAIRCNGNTPKLGWNRGGVRSTKNLQCLRNGTKYNQGYYDGLIGSRIRAFDWHQNQ